MPGPALHLLLAGEILARRRDAPFGIAPSLATLVNAHGRVTRFLPALGWWRATVAVT